MKRLMISIMLGCATLGAAAPAAAQYHGGWGGNPFWRGAPDGVWERIGFLQQRIDRGIGDGSLDRHEGRRAQKELSKIRDWVARNRTRHYGRLDPKTEAEVMDRLDGLSRSIRWMRHDGW